jgi:MFS transporter, FHS family, glucose/mannose:H+ symporter
MQAAQYQPPKFKVSVFIAACMGMLLFGASLTTLGSLAQWLGEKFQLDAISSGTLFSIFPIGIFIGSLAFGPLCDRFGYKPILSVSMLCLGGGFIGIASVSSLWALNIFIFLFGLGGGGINGGTNAVVADISKDKGANLNLLGISFALGALGMPAILGVLTDRVSFQEIVSFIGYFALVIAAFFVTVGFPPPKPMGERSLSGGFNLLKDNVLVLIALFLACQSAFEAIINNWTTTLLASRSGFTDSQELYALSFNVVGMAATRLILGSVLRELPAKWIFAISFCCLVVGSLVLHFPFSYPVTVAALVAIGVGLAPGFPVMLGILGNRHAAQSATAFSIAISIALLGNMAVNYLMGVIADLFGIDYLTVLALVISFLMIMLTKSILRKSKTQNQ